MEDLSEGYDLYRPVLRFTSDASVPPEDSAVPAHLNPIGLIRHRSGRTLRSVAQASGVDARKLIEYEKPRLPRRLHSPGRSGGHRPGAERACGKSALLRPPRRPGAGKVQNFILF